MRVTLICEGGFAALPGLAAPVVIDTDALPTQVATRVETLASMVLQQPAAEAAATPDARTYTLHIDRDGGRSTRCYADPVPDTAAQALIDFCVAHARTRRGH